MTMTTETLYREITDTIKNNSRTWIHRNWRAEVVLKGTSKHGHIWGQINLYDRGDDTGYAILFNERGGDGLPWFMAVRKGKDTKAAMATIGMARKSAPMAFAAIIHQIATRF